VFAAVCGLISLVGAAASDRVGDRRAYFALWCIALAGLCGVFAARDLALFFAAWETTLVALAVLVRRWGGKDRRSAAYVFLVYGLLGSGLFVVALASIAVARGTLDVDALAARPIAGAGQLLPALFLLAAFAPALPLFPLHAWAPRVYVAAPPQVAILIGAGLASAASYGVIRICVGLFPQGVAAAAPVLVALCAVGALYGALAAARENDARRLIAFVALSQQALVAMAVLTATGTSLRGAVLASVSHALVIAALVLVTLELARRSSSFLLSRAGGLASSAPRLAGLTAFALLAAAGVPGTAGFAGTVLALAGVWERHPAASAVAVVASIAMAAVAAGVLRRAYHGPPIVCGRDVGWRELILMAPLVVALVGLGVAPRAALDRFGDGSLPAADLRR
jgi:NADH-quinone oxidoreductase subunit M